MWDEDRILDIERTSRCKEIQGNGPFGVLVTEVLNMWEVSMGGSHTSL
jgi:hypothetical protein